MIEFKTWSLEAQTLSCGNWLHWNWSSTPLNLLLDWTMLKDPSTHYNNPVYRTRPYGYNFFVQFYPNGLDSAAGNHASIKFALFPGDYDGLLTWPFPKTIQLSVRYQLDPQNTWTIAFAPSEKISFRRRTREPLRTLVNFNFFPHFPQQNWKLSFKWYFIFGNEIHRPTLPWRSHAFLI